MAEPATKGKLCSSIGEMKIGDYIQVYWIAPSVYAYGKGGKLEIPTAAVALDAVNKSHLNYYLNLIKVDRGLLISDRIWYHTVSWDSLNTATLIEGVQTNIGDRDGVLRSLSGGVAWADENGSSSLIYMDHGIWLKNNEWDKYIVNFPVNMIQEGKTIDDIFNADRSSGKPYTICQNTPVNGLRNRENTSDMGVNVRRICRAWSRTVDDNITPVMYTIATTLTESTYGFRPVFAYKEV